MLKTAVLDLATIGLAIAKNISFLTKIVTFVQIFYLERDAIPKYLHQKIDDITSYHTMLLLKTFKQTLQQTV